MSRPPFWLVAAVAVGYGVLTTIGLHFYQRYVSRLGLIGIVITSLALGYQGGAVWIAYWRHRGSRRLRTRLMEDIAVEFKNGKCPDCGSILFNPGPRGGNAHNIRCANCGAKFWYSPPFTSLRLLESDDRFYNLNVCRTLEEFEWR